MKIALCGLGKAGKEVVLALRKRLDMELVCGICRNDSSASKKTLGEIFDLPDLDLPVYEMKDAQLAFALHRPDVVIDFSSKEATLMLLPLLVDQQVSIVICTTGFSPEELMQLQEYGERHGIAVAYTPNVTIGINVMMNLTAKVAQCLPHFDFQITEMHHNKKTDPISGTAYKIEQVLRANLPEGKKSVPINAVRAGGYVGYHEVLAVGQNERITISHESFSRQAFADGAILAAQYIGGKCGYFEMAEIVENYLNDNPYSPINEDETKVKHIEEIKHHVVKKDSAIS